MHLPHTSRRRAALSLCLLGAIAALPVQAATLYWNTSTLSAPWTTAANWSTDAAGTIPGTVPTASDDLIFKSDPFNGVAGQVSIGSNVAANSLTFAGTSTMRLSQSGTRNLSLGAGGITLNSGVGGITIGESTNSLYTDVTASQTWSNNSSNGLAVRRLRAANSATGDVTVTLSANGTNANSFTFANSIEDSLDGLKKLSIVIDSSGTGGTTLLASGWTGGTTVKRGLLNTSAATIGSGNVKLGHTSGTATATLRINSTTAFNSSLIVQANSGSNNIEFTSATQGSSVASNITLDGNLNVGVRNVGTGSTLSGVISGTGDLIKGTYQLGTTTGLLTLTGDNTYSGDTIINYGAFTLADTGSLTFYIGEAGVNNRITGTNLGTSNLISLNGTFVFDIQVADREVGDTWTIFDPTALNESIGATFAVDGATLEGTVWTFGDFEFDQSTGILTYAIPEPSTYAALLGAGMLVAAVTRRKARR